MIKTVIAGPCSVESREQLRQITAALSAMPRVSLIRAGVWKPRTRPGGFEGLGEPALQWMQELAQEYGVQYCCEVARPEHVELCQRYGVTTVWIGARTTGNPFMVEELCSALAGSGMTVLLGAIERVLQAGVDSVGAVHRGFSMYHNQGYRNAPLWEVPMTLRREMPQIPLLCDPSHIGGRSDLVAQLANTAAQFDYDGLMVEVHPDPESALTDVPQQLTPAAFADLLSSLPSVASHLSPVTSQQLLPLRRQIDEIDHEPAVAPCSSHGDVAPDFLYQTRTPDACIPVQPLGRRCRRPHGAGCSPGSRRRFYKSLAGEDSRREHPRAACRRGIKQQPPPKREEVAAL